jgi:hypothetical protein
LPGRRCLASPRGGPHAGSSCASCRQDRGQRPKVFARSAQGLSDPDRQDIAPLSSFAGKRLPGNGQWERVHRPALRLTRTGAIRGARVRLALHRIGHQIGHQIRHRTPPDTTKVAPNQRHPSRAFSNALPGSGLSGSTAASATC